eukprot:TRINITY_DN6141_c0_g2_i2.p1 TRINITY_DN6141_c0_g2~~TRINITY_DN6141_c0_g2_i2.p1  ORF type:complete len:313 (-),score=83.47 TRINITY_DN6141_c0_g2_i2:508-1344(-)
MTNAAIGHLHARRGLRRPLLMGAIMTILVAFAQVVYEGLSGFALPAGQGRPAPQPSAQRMERRPRDDMPRHVLEVRTEEPADDDMEVYAAPKKRVPYTINFFTTPLRSHESANFKYLEQKLQLALENVQEWVQQVDVRMTIDDATHKPVQGRHHSVQEQQHMVYRERLTAADEDMQSPTSDPLAERRQLAPYRLEVSVKMKHGSVVVSKPKHAQGSFVEAVDHMHDTLKRMMRKVKEKRIDRRRHRHAGEQKPYDVEDERLSDADQFSLLSSGAELDF